MRTFTAIAMALTMLLASALAIQPAMGFNVTASPFITTDRTMFMAPVCSTGLTILEFNSLSMTTTDFEDIDVDFPAYFDGIHLGASTLEAGAGVADSDTGGAAGGIGADGNNPTGTAAALGDASGAGLGATATANVLPFGPVGLAFPDIGQTVFQSLRFQRTYYFTDTF